MSTEGHTWAAQSAEVELAKADECDAPIQREPHLGVRVRQLREGEACLEDEIGRERARRDAIDGGRRLHRRQ